MWWIKFKLEGKQVWRSLETESESEARRRAPVVFAQNKAAHHQRSLTRQVAGSSMQNEDELKASLEWWKAVREPAQKPGQFTVPEAHQDAWDATIEHMLGQPLPPKAGDERERYASDREDETLRFIAVVQGTRVPVSTHLQAYLDENSDFSPSNISRVKMCVSTLSTWLSSAYGDDNLHVLDGRKADAYLLAHSAGKSITTLNSYVSALSGYWKWMVKRHWVAKNPWEKQSRKAVIGDLNAKKRAFTDEELVLLLSAVSDERLKAAMFIGALTGLRMTEIGRLTVADVQGGKVNVEASKTQAGVRCFPLHTALQPLIERLSAGKAPSQYLIDDLPVPVTGEKKRGYSLSRDFRELQKQVGTYERREGRRQADVDFHSLRRWFATKAERAGQSTHLISAVLGHTDGRTATVFKYIDPHLQQQLGPVVEAVLLPDGVECA